MGPVSKQQVLQRIENDYTYHKPFGNQPERYGLLRREFKKLAELIVRETKVSREQSNALTYLELASMQTNAAIARNETEEDFKNPE